MTEPHVQLFTQPMTWLVSWVMTSRLHKAARILVGSYWDPTGEAVSEWEDLQSTMVNLHTISLFILILVTLLATCHGQGKNPCHNRKWAMGRGVKCEGVHLPSLMCNRCSLKPVRPNGTFYNCKSVYNIRTKGCKEQLWKYVRANPCDKVRREQLKRFNNADVEGLDYFIYSICEECCDCIIKGTKHKHYEMLKKKHKTTRPTLYTPLRGNCPAHAHYDVSELSNYSLSWLLSWTRSLSNILYNFESIFLWKVCRVLPEIRYISKLGGPKYPRWPKICPHLTRWFFSPASKKWYSTQNAKSSYVIKRFLNSVNFANSCSWKSIWSKCLTMEMRQSRVWYCESIMCWTLTRYYRFT